MDATSGLAEAFRPLTGADLRITGSARRIGREAPLPLFAPLKKAQPYPIGALGPIMARAAMAIVSKVMVADAVAAQSVLSAAALAAQAFVDVVLPFGQSRPTSLYFVTVAGSGDRKSTADGEALWPIRRREDVLLEEHKTLMRSWRIESAAWAGEKKKIEGDKALDFEGRRQQLLDLGPEPERPLHPLLMMPDPTIEGLVKAWSDALPALGVFSAEGGQFTGGSGMSAENRLKTAAALSELWDGRPIKRVRAGDGVSVLPGRRLSVHLMMQQDVARGLISDPVLKDQGLLSRLLVAFPESLAGTRIYRQPDPADDLAIRAYGARILQMLELPLPLAEGRRNELHPNRLAMSTEASHAWIAFFDHVEIQCGADGALWHIRDFAAKAAEHAARIAAVITIVDNVFADEIPLDAMANAILIVDWYLAEACRLQQASQTDPRLAAAAELLTWLQGRPTPHIDFREVVTFGPNAFRTKAAAERVLGTLAEHGWVDEISKRPRRFRVVSPEEASA